MTELEKMQRAKMYIDKLANGINPLDDLPAADSDVINNIRISRCLFYVSDILRQVIESNGVQSKEKSGKKPFFLSADSRNQFSFSATPISISEITKRINDLVDVDTYKKLKHTDITSWLIEIHALEVCSTADGKTVKRPTEQGKALGISTEKRNGRNGEYTVVLYNQETQQFILDNLDTVIATISDKSAEKPENQGLPWTPAHEECLIDLFRKDVPVSEIATTLMRTEAGVRARLKQMGFIEHRADAK